MDHCPHCGCDLAETPSHGRSVPQNRRVHALCRELYHQWPEHGFDLIRPKSVDHLRYWIMTQIEGYHEPLRTIRISTMDPKVAYAAFRAILDESNAENVFLNLDGNQVTRTRALSTAFDKMDHPTATKLFTQMDDVIAALPGGGFNAYRLLEEAKLRGRK